MARNPQLSLLIPFRAPKDSPHRARLWSWLQQYWKYELPDAEVVVSDSTSTIFSKTEAINKAFRKSSGRIVCILDADAYMDGEILLNAARNIENFTKRGFPLWYVPYRRLYRMTQLTTERILSSSPKVPTRIVAPPNPVDVEHVGTAAYGHHYGAMCQLMHREAFTLIGGMDPRFQGWGSEDVCFVRALNTLYAPYKTVDASIWHMWHPTQRSGTARLWENQKDPWGQASLNKRYANAVGNPAAMKKIVDESRELNKTKCEKLQELAIDSLNKSWDIIVK